MDNNNEIIQNWKDKIQTKLIQWKNGLTGSKVNFAYGTLCAAALYPVIEAMQTGDPKYLLVLASQLGINLIANQIQSIKDAGESKAPEYLENLASENVEIREDLDNILNKLDVIELARSTMSEEERSIFFNHLERQLPNESTIKLAERSVFINGEAKYSLITTGDRSNINYYNSGSTHNETHIHNQDPIEVKEKEANLNLFLYLTSLSNECRTFPKLPLGGGHTEDIEITLDQVYIDLNVNPFFPGNKQGTSLLNIAKELDRLVILGDPGSGKSTFIKMMAYHSALDFMNDDIIPILETKLIPVIIIMRELSEDLQKINSENPDEKLIYSQFKEIICKILNEYNLEAFHSDFLRIIHTKSTLFIFDGLDEVPQDLRKNSRIWIQEIIQKFRPSKVFITCRSRSYFAEAVMKGYKSYFLSEFDESQIKNFNLAWYRTKTELTTKQQESRAADFSDRIKKDNNILEMAGNPLLLTQMAILHQRDTKLPDRRVDLFEEIVKLLLYRWKNHKNIPLTISENLRKLLVEEKKLRKSIEHLAFESHRISKGKKETADLSRALALEILNKHFESYGLAEEFLKYLDQISGLLLGKGGSINQAETYAFPHRMFQEYLAGCYINGQVQEKKLRILAEIAGEGDYWEIVYKLSIEERYYIGKDPDLIGLAARLLNYCVSDSIRDHRLIYWSSLIAKLLGSENIKENDEPEFDINTGMHYLNDLKQKLLTVAVNCYLTPIERSEAADNLDRLGYQPEDLYEFIKIPGNEIISDFWISKYPVTNVQYARFLSEETFRDEAIWKDINEIDDYGQRIGSLDETAWRWMRTRKKRGRNKTILFPEYWFTSEYGASRACAPVVGISWYEAMAYGNWLRKNWISFKESKQKLLTPREIRLPTRYEWRLAVSNVFNDSIPKKSYRGLVDKWSIQPTISNFQDLGNFKNSGINKSTIVWLYQKGRSKPHGLYDVTGNVWEWLSNKYEGNPKIRLMAGSSFLDSGFIYELSMEEHEEKDRIDLYLSVDPQNQQLDFNLSNHQQAVERWYTTGFRLCLR